MVLLASLLGASEQWYKATIRLLVVVKEEGEIADAKTRLDQVLSDAKLRADAPGLGFCEDRRGGNRSRDREPEYP